MVRCAATHLTSPPPFTPATFPMCSRGHATRGGGGSKGQGVVSAWALAAPALRLSSPAVRCGPHSIPSVQTTDADFAIKAAQTFDGSAPPPPPRPSTWPYAQPMVPEKLTAQARSGEGVGEGTTGAAGVTCLVVLCETVPPDDVCGCDRIE